MFVFISLSSGIGHPSGGVAVDDRTRSTGLGQDRRGHDTFQEAPPAPPTASAATARPQHLVRVSGPALFARHIDM